MVYPKYKTPTKKYKKFYTKKKSHYFTYNNIMKSFELHTSGKHGGLAVYGIPYEDFRK